MLDGISNNHAGNYENIFSLSRKDKSGEKKEDEKKAEAEVEALRKRDREVRAHEMAHVRAGGNLIRSGPNYDYQTGPDGKRYAIGGDVQIDTSPEDEPEKTIAKAERIIRAALAPADPSAQDRKVASDAQSMKQDALKELQKERDEKNPYLQTEKKGNLIDFKI